MTFTVWCPSTHNIHVIIFTELLYGDSDCTPVYQEKLLTYAFIYYMTPIKNKYEHDNNICFF